MAKRYYICDIIGDGTEAGPFRPSVADVGVSWVGSIPSDPVTGHPLHTRCAVIVNASTHEAVRDLPGVEELQEAPSDFVGFGVA